jgi:hypothetical protein
MKYFLLIALVFSLLFSSCAPATQPPQPTVTPITPSPTATITLTPTQTPSSTTDPMQLVIIKLEKVGINVDTKTGKITYKGIEVPGTAIDAMGLHIQIGDQKIDISQIEMLKRFSVKEGSVVIYDKSIDLYNDPNVNNWPKVEWAFNPDAKTELWRGWASRDKTISSTVFPHLTVENFGDTIVPVLVGDTWDEYHDFVKVERAFLQPFPQDAVLPNPTNKNYEGVPDSTTPPFKVDDWSKFGMRNAVNFWIVKANHEEKRESDTGGITEQVLNPKDKSDIQTLHFVYGDNRKRRISYYFKDDSRYGTVFANGYLMPEYYIGGPIWRSGYGSGNIRSYYAQFGYADQPYGYNVNNRVNDLVHKWLDTEVVPEELQKIWLGSHAWFVR